MDSPPDGASAEDLRDLGIDLEAMLERDSRVLLDPNFLSTLHTELESELGGPEAALALAQMGFLHGMKDALRAAAEEPSRRGPTLPIVPSLRMRCRTRRTDGPAGALELVGSWPEAHEASARLSSLGADGDVVCHLSAGYTSGWLSGAFDADLLALETECSGCGRSACRFVAREAAVWQERDDARAHALLEVLPYDLFRAVARERLAHEAHGRTADVRGGDRIDRGAPLIHVWGPVMVIPFGSPDECLSALDLIGRDASVADVSVVIIDLAEALVDEAFGSLALEQIVQTAEAWGAETLFAEVSPMSERVIADLDHPPLLVVKNLEQAVSIGFQIARSQRTPI